MPARLGEARAEEGAYVWQKLMQSGAVVANGTDVPVERIDPMPNLYATDHPQDARTARVFYPDQRMSREEALKSYTYNAAYAAKEEQLKGSLAVGKLADITVLTKDILTVPEDEIPATGVAYTIVGGKVTYTGPAAATASHAARALTRCYLFSASRNLAQQQHVLGRGGRRRRRTGRRAALIALHHQEQHEADDAPG